MGNIVTSKTQINPVVGSFISRKQKSWKFAALTAYDYPMGRLLDDLGLDFLLVGDSLGMVVLGHPDTTEVTLENMAYHTRAVARGVSKTLLIADLPAHSTETEEIGVQSARRLVEAGANGVKAEGGEELLPVIRAILDEGIPVLGHIGMLPQKVKEEGGKNAAAGRATHGRRDGFGCCGSIWHGAGIGFATGCRGYLAENASPHDRDRERTGL
jgi:3-methyl-2-oxobutanoate hydroxymethyltransferase